MVCCLAVSQASLRGDRSQPHLMAQAQCPPVAIIDIKVPVISFFLISEKKYQPVFYTKKCMKRFDKIFMCVTVKFQQ